MGMSAEAWNRELLSLIEPNKLAAQGLHVMEKHAPHPITVLPVVKDGRAVGMLHITDLLKQGVV